MRYQERIKDSSYLTSRFEVDLEIDKFALDDEWQFQAALFKKWSDRYAQAMLEVDRAKEQLELVKAELDGDIRLDPGKYGFEKKPNNDSVTATIIAHEKYSKANSNFIEARKNSLILAGAKEAMAHKKKALDGLTQLWIAGYYADRSPKSKVMLDEQTEGSTKEAIKKKLSENDRIRQAAIDKK